MVSEKQFEANRKNAQKSTGPKTPEGKEASRINALKHGMRVKSFDVLPYEDQDDFDALIDSLFEHYLPTNPIEERLVRRIAIHYWRLERIDLYDHLLLTGRVGAAMTAASRARRDRYAHAVRKLLPPGEEAHKYGLDKIDALTLRAEVETTADGCRWLIGVWRQLREMPLARRSWSEEQEMHAMRLLGCGPSIVYDRRFIGVMLANNMARRPDFAHTAEYPFNGALKIHFDRQAIRDAFAAGRKPADLDSALAVMVATAEGEIDRLEQVLARREQEVTTGLAQDREEAEKAGIAACFDLGLEAERLRRYQVAIERQLLRAVEVLEKLRRRERLSQRDMKTAANGANEANSRPVGLAVNAAADEASNGANEPNFAADVQALFASGREISVEPMGPAWPTASDRQEHRRKRPSANKLINDHRSRRRRNGK